MRSLLPRVADGQVAVLARVLRFRRFMSLLDRGRGRRAILY
jgi:hypothetical protein